MAYDAAQGQVVLFGGVTPSGLLGDTCVGGLTAWQLLGHRLRSDQKVQVAASFMLTNTGPPVSLAAVSGTLQTALVGTPFSAPLRAEVRDSDSGAHSNVFTEVGNRVH